MQALACTAVAASAINIGGGFTITNRMLNMFRRPTDPVEYNNLYALPGAVLVAGCAAGQLAGTVRPSLLSVFGHLQILRTEGLVMLSSIERTLIEARGAARGLIDSYLVCISNWP